MLLQQSVPMGNSKETNVRLWTFAGMMDMVHEGGRFCKGTSGLFVAQGDPACQIDVEGVLTRETVLQSDAANTWCIRETNQVGIEAARQLEIDGKNYNQLTLFSSRYQDQATQPCENIGELVERLHDTKVGLEKADTSMNDILHGIGGLTT